MFNVRPGVSYLQDLIESGAAALIYRLFLHKLNHMNDTGGRGGTEPGDRRLLLLCCPTIVHTSTSHLVLKGLSSSPH